MRLASAAQVSTSKPPTAGQNNCIGDLSISLSPSYFQDSNIFNNASILRTPVLTVWCYLIPLLR